MWEEFSKKLLLPKWLRTNLKEAMKSISRYHRPTLADTWYLLCWQSWTVLCYNRKAIWWPYGSTLLEVRLHHSLFIPQIQFSPPYAYRLFDFTPDSPLKYWLCRFACSLLQKSRESATLQASFLAKLIFLENSICELLPLPYRAGLRRVVLSVFSTIEIWSLFGRSESKFLFRVTFS